MKWEQSLQYQPETVALQGEIIAAVGSVAANVGFVEGPTRGRIRLTSGPGTTTGEEGKSK